MPKANNSSGDKIDIFDRNRDNLLVTETELSSVVLEALKSVISGTDL